jgi:hypothetical protein
MEGEFGHDKLVEAHPFGGGFAGKGGGLFLTVVFSQWTVYAAVVQVLV